MQNEEIQKMFEEWPIFSRNHLEHVRIDKISYYGIKL